MEMFFTSKQAAEITGCTLRQLQYWREKEVIVPVVKATGTGRSVYYSKSDLVQLALMKSWLSVGLSFEVAREILKTLKDREVEFSNFDRANRFMLRLDSAKQVSSGETGLKLKLVEFDLEQAIALLKEGQPIIPVWLDAIHQRLENTERV